VEKDGQVSQLYTLLSAGETRTIILVRRDNTTYTGLVHVPIRGVAEATIYFFFFS
jgi:hypothetical protein